MPSIKIKEDLGLNAVRQAQSFRSNRKPSQPKSAQSETFCRVCMIARLLRDIYLSHNPMDEKCTSLSVTDKKRLSKALLSNIKDVPEVDEDELAKMYGYPSNNENNGNVSRNDALKCGYIRPVPSQILTVYIYDGVTKLKGIGKIGEIHETFFRNNCRFDTD